MVIPSGCCDEVAAGAGAACVWTAAELGGGACGTGVELDWAGGIEGAGCGVEDGVVEEVLGDGLVGMAGGDEVEGTAGRVVVLVCWTVTVVVCAIGELAGCMGVLIDAACAEDVASAEDGLAAGALVVGASGGGA